MQKQINFNYQGKQYAAVYIVSAEHYPIYVFVSFLHPDLIKKFGEDIAIKTDGNKVVGQSDIPVGINDLKRTLFQIINQVEQLNLLPPPKKQEWQRYDGF